MPSIKESMGVDLSKYKPAPDAPSPPVVTQMVTEKQRANPNLRCPLPPFNSNPDTLRQFETGDAMPKLRVIPLPVHNGFAAPSRASVASSSSSSGSSTIIPTPAKLTAVSVTLNTGAVSAGASFTGSVQMAESFQLLSITVDSLCEVRVYGTSAAQSFDQGRVTGDPVPPEITSNILTCVSFEDTLSWQWQNRMGANQDNPQTPTIYVSVFSPADQTNIAVTITYLPLES